MHAWIIPVSLVAMALIGWAIQPNNLDRLWWRLEGWINGDPPLPYEEVFGAPQEVEFFYQQVERHPTCPGYGCPHQMKRITPYQHNVSRIGAEPIRYQWSGDYCWRYLP